MSLQVIETGELVEPLTKVEAERLTSRIADKLDDIADNLDQVLPLIGEALTREAWKVLGYASPTSYVQERFTGVLTRLPREIRQPVVQALKAAGMSTRAIAPIVGVSFQQASKDTQVSPQATPEPSGFQGPSERIVPEPAMSTAGLPVSERIVGTDGKTYTRREPATAAVEAPKPKRRPITDQARDAGWDIRKATEKLQRLFEDDRLGRNKDEVATHLRSHLMFTVETCQGLLDQINQ